MWVNSHLFTQDHTFVRCKRSWLLNGITFTLHLQSYLELLAFWRRKLHWLDAKFSGYSTLARHCSALLFHFRFFFWTLIFPLFIKGSLCLKTTFLLSYEYGYLKKEQYKRIDSLGSIEIQIVCIKDFSFLKFRIKVAN